MSYFAPTTVTVVLNPDDDPVKQNSVVLRKWTGEERQRILSSTMVASQHVQVDGTPNIVIDVPRLRLETLKVCVTSWNGPDFDGRPATPQNVALLPPDILDQLVEASDKLNQGITEDKKKYPLCL